MQIQLDVRIHVAQAIARGLQFRPADIARAVQNLALQIRKLDPIGIDQARACPTPAAAR